MNICRVFTIQLFTQQAMQLLNMGVPLTPVASYDGAVVANNLIKGNTMKSDYNGLPSVVFTIPLSCICGYAGKRSKRPRATIQNQT